MEIAAPSLDPITKHLQKRLLLHRTWPKIPSPVELLSQGTQGEWSAQKHAGERAAPAPHHLPEDMAEHLFSSLRVLRKSPATEGSDLTHKIQRTLWAFFWCKGFPSLGIRNKELLLNPFQLWLVWSHTAQGLSEHCSSFFSLQNITPCVLHSHQTLLDGIKLTKHQL